MRKTISSFVYGTHYYRSPTPTPSEWDSDMKLIKAAGINAIQFRANWSWHERKKGEFRFEESDHFFDLAEKHGLAVNFKFLLECAPFWLYEEINAARISPSGAVLQPYNRGAFYTGGFMPCFDRDDLRKEAERFINAVVQRYKSKKNLLLWNVWNEPRSRPFGECACTFSNEKYKTFLKKKFQSIDAYNNFFGFAYGTFEQIKPPVSHRSYAEVILWRLFRAEMVADRVSWIARFVRSIDDTRAIIAHSGFVSPLMDPLTDMTNDSLNGKDLDFYGSSSPTRDIDMSYLKRLRWPHKYTITPLVCDRLRGLDEYFFAHELYPNNADFEKPIPASDMELDVWNAIAGGAKGTMFWQYKSERLGDEVNRSGLVKVSGEPTDKYDAAAKIGAVIEKNNALFRNSRIPSNRIAILYDIESDLLSRLQFTTDTNYPETTMFGLDDYEYKRAIRGAHMALWELGINTDIIPTERIELIKKYPVVYMPLPLHVNDSVIGMLEQYVKDGGVVISEASPGIRDANYWLSGSVPRGKMREMFGCVEQERYYADTDGLLIVKSMRVGISKGDLISFLKVEHGDVIGKNENGRAVAVQNSFGKGRTVLLGFSLGACYFNAPSLSMKKLLQKVIGNEVPKNLIDIKLTGSRLKSVVHETDNGYLVFLMNFGEKKASALSSVFKKSVKIYGEHDVVKKSGSINVDANSCSILSIENIKVR